MFLLPVTFLALLISRRRSYILEDRDILSNFVFPINFATKYLYIVAGIWFIATVVNVIIFIRKSKKRHELLSGNIPEDDSLAMDLFEDMKIELGIRGKVELCRNDMLTSPIVTGIFRHKVILPYEHYEKNELRVIFMHELTHVRKHDLVYKALTILIVALQSFNPCAYKLIHLLNRWSEQDCDRKSVERLEKEGVSSKDYFKVIWESVEPENREKRDIYIFSMLFEDKGILERRVEFMNKYGKKNKKTPKIVTAALVMTFILASTCTSYAAGVEIAQKNDEVFKETQVVGVEKYSVAAQSGEEFMVSAEDNALVVEYCPEEVIAPYAGNTFDWVIPVGTRYTTTQKWFSKGTEVSIAVTVSPSDVTYWFGLMYPNGSSSVCEISGVGSHTFTVPSSGFYRVMVENRGSKEITALGAYSY